MVGSLGRVFDLIIVERPAKLASLAEATLEDALFESGRPVLMTPPTPLPTIGERVLVAWNGSTETARTLGFAMPFLKHAKTVGITAGASAPEVLVDDVIEALRRIGPVTVSVLPGREENIEFRLPAELAAG